MLAVIFFEETTFCNRDQAETPSGYGVGFGQLEVNRPLFTFAWLSLSVAEWSSADPCTELDRAFDLLIPAVRNSGKQIDQASHAREVASANNAYADAAEKLGTTIKRLRPELETLPADEPVVANERGTLYPWIPTRQRRAPP
jgi:hypothetical protein